MRIAITALALPLAALLSACNPPADRNVGATTPPEAGNTATAPNRAACGADKLDDFINVLPSTDILDKIKARIGDKTIRVINPGDAVTMDFRADRLNIENGEDGRIKKFGCY